LNQTYTQIEIVVVDNCSTDGTWNVLERIASSDTRLKIFRNNTNIGPVRNWQRAISESRGQYLKILWSDDMLMPTAIAEMVSAMQPTIAFVYSTVRYVDENNQVYGHILKLNKSGILSTRQYLTGWILENKYPVSASAALFRREDIVQKFRVNIPNRLDVDFAQEAIGNDLLMFCDLCSAYPSFYVIETPLVCFGTQADSISISTSREKLKARYWLAMCRFIDECDDVQLAKLANSRIKAFNIFSKHYNLPIEKLYSINPKLATLNDTMQFLFGIVRFLGNSLQVKINTTKRFLQGSQYTYIKALYKHTKLKGRS